MAEVRARAITKLFRAKSTLVEAVKSLDMDIRDGEFVVFVGPSGSGKSTFLRLVAGLELPNSGHLYIGNREVTTTHPRARGVAMVFQDYALYPHMSVRENMSFALENLKRPREEIKRRVNDAASMLRIGDLLERRPRELSGGQRQRVAVGRAIVRQPEAFLFDEPLSNLDAILRVQMRVELADLHRRLGTTSIYVTHDQVEAMTLGQRIVVMNYGAIQQVGTSAELYDTPANTFVASFIGSPPMNMLAGRLEQTGGGLALILDGAQITLPPSVAQRYASYAGREVQFGLRPENITMPNSPLAAGALSVPVAVRLLIVENLGAEKLVHFTIGEQPCVARMPVDAPISRSGEVQLGFTLTKMHLFDRTTGLALLPRAND